MANRRKSMKKIREILRMRECGLSERGIAAALKVSRPTVSDYLTAFRDAGINHEKANSMSDADLLKRIEKPVPKPDKYRMLEKEFPYYIKELKRTGVTVQLLWEEYLEKNPDGYKYSQFCHHFYTWRKQSNVTMHIEHTAGEKTFVDFAGDKLRYCEFGTGEIHEVDVFVAILGASQLTYAEAVEGQKKEDWIKGTENAFRYFGGVTSAVVPDNAKAAVTKADLYEPEINPQYADFAAHYNTVILPARPRKPKDKPLVEGAVRLMYERVYAPLRDQVFGSLVELNQAIKERLEAHNDRPMKKLQTSRRKIFEETERAKLKPLPATRYEFKRYQGRTTIQTNYHVFLKEDKHYYSVPYKYRLQGQKISIYYGDSSVELYSGTERIAIYRRSRQLHGYTTTPEHMPSHHKHFAEQSPERFLRRAEAEGLSVRKIVQSILNSRKFPEQSFRSCNGILGLARKYDSFRLNRACKRAFEYGEHSYRSVKNILEKGLDKIEEEQPELDILPLHENVRGSAYYENGDNNE